MTTLANYPGMLLPTKHLVAGVQDEVLLTFSDDDNKLACNEWQQGEIGIWNPFSGNRIFQIHEVPGALTAFSGSSELFATCNKTGLGVWNVASSERVFQCEWPNKDDSHRPSYLSFTSASELVIAFESQLVVIEVSTGKVVKTYPFGESGRASLQSVASVDDSYIAYYTEPTSQGERFQAVEIPRNARRLSIEMGPDDMLMLGASTNFALVRRSMSNRGEVWDVQAGAFLHEVPLPGLWEGMQFGPGDRYLAQAYEEAPQGGQQSRCILEVWNLRSGKCDRSFDVLSTQILWSPRSGLLALTRFVEGDNHPEESMVLFTDSLSGLVRGHAYEHCGRTVENYSFSPSGRWLASVIAFNNLSRQGKPFSSGMIALTDLASILEPTTTPVLPSAP